MAPNKKIKPWQRSASMPTRRLRVGVWSAALAIVGAGVGAVCVMSASDRLAEISTHPARSYLGGNAAGQLAVVKLAEKDVSALDAANRFVKTDPVDPAAPSTLGTIQLAMNRPERAYDAFRVAGGLGWRNIPTQLYWLAAARATGDVATTAQRADALLRMNTDNQIVESALIDLADTPVGQSALATLLRQNPPWEARFFNGTGDLAGPQLTMRLAVLDKAARSGAHFDCEDVASAARQLIHQKDYQHAKALWQITCGNRTEDLIFDGNFESSKDLASSSPFAWHLYSRGGLNVSFQPAPPPLEGQAVHADSSLTVRTPILSQTTVLPPGSYRVSWGAVHDDGKPDPNISIMVLCNDTREFLDLAMMPSASSAVEASSAHFTVPSEGCPLQTLVIEMAAAQPGQEETGWVDDISLARL